MIVNNPKNIQLFISDLKKFNTCNNKIMCLDMEFNTNDIALVQLKLLADGFEPQIYVTTYSQFTEEELGFIMDSLYLNSSVIKLMYGADTLDFQHLVKQNILKTENQIDKFINGLIDIRYFCEFDISKRNVTSKLSNYHNCLFDNNIITKEKYIELVFLVQQICSSLKPSELDLTGPSRVFIDINIMTNELYTYAINDVMYLPELYYHYKKKILPETFDLIIALNNFILHDKFGSAHIFDKYNKYYNDYNILFILTKFGRKQFISIFQEILDSYNLKNTDIDHILKTKNIMQYIKLYLRIICFNILGQRYRIKQEALGNAKHELFDSLAKFNNKTVAVFLRSFENYADIHSNVIV